MLFGKAYVDFRFGGVRFYRVWLNTKMLRSAFLAGKIAMPPSPKLVHIHISE